MKKTIVVFLFSLLLFLNLGWYNASHLSAQNDLPLLPKGEWKPRWQDTPARISFEKEEFLGYAFKGCLYDETLPNLPYAAVEVNLENNPLEQIEYIDGIAEEEEVDYYAPFINELGSRLFKEPTLEWSPALPILKGPILNAAGKRTQLYFFYPIQVHKSGKKIRKYTQLKWKYLLSENDLTEINITKSAKRTYRDNSVLAQGDWYKIGVLKNGIYRLDKTFFQNLGLNPQTINPQNIKIYGNGGGMLPQANHIPRQDDLWENPIWVAGQEDGVFNDQDYILFYGQGPALQFYDTAAKRIRYENHLYADTCYYFITVGSTPGKRLVSRPSLPTAATVLQTTPQFLTHHQDKTNLIKSGRLWFGDVFDFQTSYSYPFAINNPAQGSVIKIRIRVAARSDAQSTFTITANGVNIGNIAVDRINSSCYWCTYAQVTLRNFEIPAELVSGDRLTIGITYNKRGAALGWLDYIEIEYEQRLNYRGGQYRFGAYPEANGDTNGAIGFQMANAGSVTQIWDISRPQEPILQQFERQGSGIIFYTRSSTQALEYIALDGLSFLTPIPIGRIPNQNLHGLPPAEYLMVAHQAFLPAAQRLAEFHRNHYKRTVHVVTPQQIYNEFSSGMQDVSAIRDFVKMFYDRAAGDAKIAPQYLLLLGDGSYDPRQVVTKGNFIPSYQARQSLYPPESYTSDDFYGFLDEDEGFWGENNDLFEEDKIRQTHSLDIGIGRLPANTLAEAQSYVDKIIRYATSPEQFGDWRNRVLLIGDYKQNEPNHMREADSHDKNKIRRLRPCLNVDKIYLDSYPLVMLAEGARYPAAKAEMLDKINKGALIVNYTGHGGETGLSNARILEIPDILQLSNTNRLGFWITATCEFGKYDDPERPTGAEYLLQLNDRGAIGLITSVRQVFSQANFVFNQNIYDFLFAYNAEKRRYATLGEVMRQTKNKTWGAAEINTRNFVLLGDPGISLSFPVNKAVLKAINNTPIGSGSGDTLRALARVTLEGEVQEPTGALLEDFNGVIRALVFDKPQRMTTLTENFVYEWQKNILFRGAVSVRQGKFKIEFIMPLDISYEIGKGKISFYAQDSARDASGCFEDIIICCTKPGAIRRNTPPEITLKMNSEDWVSGSITHPSPLLIADIKDDEGINTSGLGIGRELAAVLNGNDDAPIILNDFYQTKNNSFQEGVIYYRFQNLADGEYHLQVKVWDVANNSAVAETRFVVKNNAKLEVQNIQVYPNPASDRVTFSFNHNQFDTPLTAQLTIFDSKGARIKEFNDAFTANSSIERRFIWDGTDTFGTPVSQGLYYMRLSLRAEGTQDVFYACQKVMFIK
jgi:hypothetical protein